MKKILTLIAAMAAFVACSKVDITAPDADETQNREIKFNINVGGFGGPETKAVKTDWASGDKINIWFNCNYSQVPDLVMTYDGSAWSYGDLDDTVAPEDGQKFVAVYEGFNDLSQYDYVDYYFRSPSYYGGYNFPMVVCSKGTYEYSDDTITADLSAGWAFGTRLQVYVDGLSQEKPYGLSCSSLRPLTLFGPTEAGEFDFSKESGAGSVAQGVPFGDGMAFYFYDNYTGNGSSADYYFELTEYSASGLPASNRRYAVLGKTVTIDSKKCQSIKISASKFAGILPGKFSIGNGKQIQFSKGNLVATIDASGTPTAWKFAANQYDYLGEGGANQTIGTAAGDVDLFGWPTAATKYGITDSDYFGVFKDWGKNIDDGSTWRTLSKDEWVYLFETRTNASGLYKYGVTVCGKTDCVVIAPDGFTGTIETSYDATTWPVAEAAGLVCLPAAGFRDVSTVYNDGWSGHYCSSTALGGDVYFNRDSFDPDYYGYRGYGLSVRLITDVEGSSPVEPDPVKEDPLSGKFSVSASKQVQFSKGNLVATIDASGIPTAWKFAANQYDYLGEGGANKTIGTAAGDVDLFGWSTAVTKYGISTSTDDADYSGDFVDWGKDIGDGSTWRTLSKDEWVYLFKTRTNASSLYKYRVTVCGKTNCIVIAPDGFTGTIETSYDATTWPVAEAAGLVCLPAAGYRDGSNGLFVGDCGIYWSSTAYDSSHAYYVFNSNYVIPDGRDFRHFGLSVRLITDVK